MHRSTSRFVTLSLCIVCSSACLKDKSEYIGAGESSLFQDNDPYSPSSTAASNDPVRMALAAASASIDSSDSSDDPAGALECPSTTHWSKFDTFAAPCTYAWTSDVSHLPSAPLWQSCSDFDDIPRSVCKQFKRSRRIKTFHVGANTSKEMQIGFVENCAADQIVLADIDGPARFALRRTETSQFPTTCQMKLLAVDAGQWLVAIGASGIPSEFDTSGYSAGGAFIGGAIGSAPNVLFADSSAPFHVASSDGTILPDGWSANGKRRRWNGKPTEKPPRIGLLRLTKRLFVDEHKGFYSTTKADPELLLEIPKGHSVAGFQFWDKHIIWQEHAVKHGLRTCTLIAGEIDAQDSLVSPRRIAEIPCTMQKFAIGCNSVLMGTETQLVLLSLSNGSSRTLRAKGHVAAVDCKEALIERSGTLLRIDLLAFGPTKAPPTPPTELQLKPSGSGVPK